jgi:hypothetical protein
MRRISVIRNEQIVPLLPGKPLNDSVFSPWSNLILEKHCVGAIEIPAHEHSSFCLQMQTSGPSKMEWWSEGRSWKESLGQGIAIGIAAPALLFLKKGISGFRSRDLKPVVMWEILLAVLASIKSRKICFIENKHPPVVVRYPDIGKLVLHQLRAESLGGGVCRRRHCASPSQPRAVSPWNGYE